ncbi:MAG TPA: ABC transporter substrate binding protein, partial [Candidatus Binatia bacterium]|nr:ABC transporter substrate binding protein [Candidatus Binatia bacterium]
MSYSVGDNRQKSKLFYLPWILVLLVFAGSAEAQQPTKLPRIGFLGGSTNTPVSNLNVLRQALRDLGYIEGQNILLEYRNAEGNVERFPSLVAELVQLRVDVLVSTNPTAISAAKETTHTIPI